MRSRGRSERFSPCWGPDRSAAPHSAYGPQADLGDRIPSRVLPEPNRSGGVPDWKGYYRWTAGRPPRELLMRTLDHVHWETRTPRSRRAIDLGCGAGNDSLELLRQGWKVLAIDRQAEALRMLSKRVPARLRGSLTMLVAPMEGLSLPPADLINASFSLPFCAPDRFEELWAGIRTSLRPGGHFAGQLFGTRDEWHGHRPPRSTRAPRCVGWPEATVPNCSERPRKTAGRSRARSAGTTSRSSSRNRDDVEFASISRPLEREAGLAGRSGLRRSPCRSDTLSAARPPRRRTSRSENPRGDASRGWRRRGSSRCRSEP